MKIKTTTYQWLFFFSALTLFFTSLSLLDRNYFKKNRFFCVWELYSQTSQHAKWDPQNFSSLSHEEWKDVFSHPFTFIGRGLQSVAFESLDGIYVIKFYRFPIMMRPAGFLAKPLSTFSDKRKQLNIKDCENYQNTLASHALAFNFMKAESALVATHLDKTINCPYVVTIIDPLGSRYKISLKDTIYLIQKKGDLLFPTLKNVVKQNDLKILKKIVFSSVFFIYERSLKGVQDTDPMLEKNYALLNNKLFQLDTGNLILNTALKEPAQAMAETLKVTAPLKQWLELESEEGLKYYYDAIKYLNNKKRL
jgi:hypothetical protein